MKKVLSIILIILIVLVLLFNIVSIFEFSFFGFRVFKVATGSMEPTITVGSVIVVKKTDDLEMGDIITYQDSRGYTTHRIVDITEESITTRGDANPINDEPITRESVIGKVIVHLNIFGFIVYFFKNPVSWILIFLIGVLLLFIVPVKIPHQKLVKKEKIEDKNKTEEKEEIKDKEEEISKVKKKTKKKNRFAKYYE